MAARAGLLAVGAAVAVALIVGAWDAIADGWHARARVTQASGDAARPAPAGPANAGGLFRPHRGTPPALEPAIAEGRRELGDSMFAVREGEQVTVNFDTEDLRTRFDWKFEGVVRTTLPLVFPDSRAALDSIPTGTLASGGGLLTDLPSRGIPIRMGSATLRVWPVTRQGRDGPIVIGYRAAATR